MVKECIKNKHLKSIINQILSKIANSIFTNMLILKDLTFFPLRQNIHIYLILNMVCIILINYSVKKKARK